MCAVVGARLRGASLVLGVDSNPNRIAMAKILGADDVYNFKDEDPVARILKATHGKGVDVAIGETQLIIHLFLPCIIIN